MKKTMRSSLLLSVGLVLSFTSLVACSSNGGKGPGPIGTKEDIIVHNRGVRISSPTPDSVPVERDSILHSEDVQNEVAASTETEPSSPVPPADTIAEDKLQDTSSLPPSDPVEPVTAQEGSYSNPSDPKILETSEKYEGSEPPMPQENGSSSVQTGSSASVSAPVVSQDAPVSATPTPPSSSINLSDPILISAVQGVLKASGLYNGPLDGRVDTGYLNALSVYQGRNNLPQGGLNEETLRKMGVIE